MSFAEETWSNVLQELMQSLKKMAGYNIANDN